MGKLIQFPIERVQHRARRLATTANFGAFSELESSERTQLRFIAGGLCLAVVMMGVLQLGFS